MRADWGTKDEAIGKLMDKLQGSRQIRLLAIFPADRPHNPVVLKTFYTKAKLIAKLNAAGSSKVANKQELARDVTDPATILSKLP